MNRLRYFIICLILIVHGSHAQNTPKKEIYTKDFNWTITIPEDFENVSAAEWEAIQNEGADAIERTYNEKVINQSKTIFVFKSDEVNYFEANYQPFDLATDGDYLESCEKVNQMLYNTIKREMRGIEVGSTTTTEKIDNLEFHTFKIKVELPNDTTLNVLMYSRLFGNKDFSVHIMYMDDEKGQQMLEAWKNSKFVK